MLLLANGRELLQKVDFDPEPAVKLMALDGGAIWVRTGIDPG